MIMFIFLVVSDFFFFYISLEDFTLHKLLAFHTYTNLTCLQAEFVQSPASLWICFWGEKCICWKAQLCKSGFLKAGHFGQLGEAGWFEMWL